MKKMEDNDLNNLSKKLFENYSLEKLPADFTEKLMIRIEKEKSPEVRKQGIFNKKFFLLFSLTFLSIISLAIFSGNSATTDGNGSNFYDILKYINFEKIEQFFNIKLEISLIIKLVVLTSLFLLIIDKIAGSIIDRFLDSGTEKNNP